MAVYSYQSISAVPPAWRRIQGAALTLTQINEIVQRADALREETGAASLNACLATARKEFANTHEILDSQWVTKQS